MPFSSPLLNFTSVTSVIYHDYLNLKNMHNLQTMESELIKTVCAAYSHGHCIRIDDIWVQISHICCGFDFLSFLQLCML